MHHSIKETYLQAMLDVHRLRGEKQFQGLLFPNQFN